MDFPRAIRTRSTSPILKKYRISKTRFRQNCSVAKMLCFAVLSASLPCAIVSKMHVLKNAHEARNTAWDSDFVSCHHDNARLRTLPLLVDLLLLLLLLLPLLPLRTFLMYLANSTALQDP